MRLRFPALLLALALTAPAWAQPQGIRATDVFQIRELGDVALSPDGRLVAYTVREIVEDPNRRGRRTYRTHLWLAPLDGSAPARPLTRGDRGATNPLWHPDGERIAFVRSVDGRAQVHLLPLDGGEPYPVTDLRHGATPVAFSPDGTRLLVASSLPRAAVEGTPPWPSARPGPEPDPLPEGIEPDPDGDLAQVRAWLDRQDEDLVLTITRMNFQGELTLQAEPSLRRLFVVPLDGSEVERVPEARPLTRGFQGTSGGAWSPDGRYVVFAAAADTTLHPDDARQSALYRVPAEGGRPERLLAPEGWSVGAPQPLPDGRFVFTATRLEDEGYAEVQIGLTDGRGGWTWLTETFDRSAAQVTPARDGRYVYFVAPTDGGFPLYRIPLAGAPRVERLTDLETGIRSYDVGPQGMAFVLTSIEDPYALYAADAEARTPRLLHAPNAAWIAERTLSRPSARTLPITIPVDGRMETVEMQYWVMEPVNRQPGRRYPVVLQIHGGPAAMWGPGEATMWHEFQLFASRGFGVVYSNPRGSGGYGYAFRRANFRDWGPGPAADVLAALEAAIEAEDWIDPDRLVVTGGSYAGYLTAWIVSQDHRFRAAAAQRGVYDLPTFFGEGNAWRLVPTHFGGFPWEPETLEILRAQSPLTHVAEIRTPLLIKHGSQDLRTGVIQSEMLYRSLRALDRPVEYARYPRAGHELSRSGDPDQRLDRLVRIVEFLERHVRPDALQAAETPTGTPAGVR